MRLSVVFELLLIFLIIAFAASRVIEPKNKHHKRIFKKGKKQISKQSAPNKYCACSSTFCNCCRDFNLPIVQLRGPGCATISFLKDNEVGIAMKFGERVVRNITLSGRKPRPVCMGLPGGVSKFCGRVYGLEKQDDQFKACLGLELRSLEKVEAALRVSCFRMGPSGLRVEPAEPFPEASQEKVDEEDEYDDDDDYDIGDDDDDDDDDYGLSEDDDDDDDATSGEDAADNDVDSVDYTGFSALSDEFLDGFFGSDSTQKKKKKPVNAKPTPTVSTSWPSRRPSKRPKPVRTQSAGIIPTTSRTKLRLTTPKVISTTEKAMPPSSPPTVMETPLETTEEPEDETEEPLEDETEEDYMTSTMMTITSMQVIHEKENDDRMGASEDIAFTTEQTTTEEQTEIEEIKPTDRVAAVKELINDPKASINIANDKSDEEDEEDEDDDDDSDDVDMTSVVGAGLLDDDDEDTEETAAQAEDTKTKPVHKGTFGMLEGILDDMDDEDEDDDKKVKDKQRNIPSAVPATDRVPTTYQTSDPTPFPADAIGQTISSILLQTALNQTQQPLAEKFVTPPPLGGMRLYFSDPRHPPKGRSPLSARSGREHRRMRLPSVGTEVVMT